MAKSKGIELNVIGNDASDDVSSDQPGELIIKDLHATIDGTEILKGVNLTVKAGQIAALMGPNGSGKSTLSHVLMGHDTYEVTNGSVTYKGQDVLDMSPDERAKLGMFLSFQYPVAIPGVTLTNFLRLARNAVKDKQLSVIEFRKLLRAQMELLKMDQSFVNRYLNDGFSGGEKKRCEILQMAILEPTMSILDETDSGLDIDAMKIVANGVNTLFKQRKNEMGLLLITHYQRLLDYIKPDVVHILVDGKIVKTGDAGLAIELEKNGYEKVLGMKIQESGSVDSQCC